MSNDLQALKQLPVPSSAEAQARKRGYRDAVKIAIDGEAASEPCVEARAIGLAGDNHYFSAFNPPYHQRIPGSIEQLFVRRSVGEKLSAVNARLAGAGLELYLLMRGDRRRCSAISTMSGFPTGCASVRRTWMARS